jgi:hypothetical protein
MGIYLMDMHHWYKHEKKVHNLMLCGTMCEDDASGIHLSDLLCGVLVQMERLSPGIRPNLQDGQETILTRIEVDRKTNGPPTTNNLEKKNTLGQPYYVNCFACCKYLKDDDTTVYNQTCFHMPICNNRKERRSKAIGRDFTCEE